MVGAKDRYLGPDEVIILAAGAGRRLEKVTAGTPKSLLPVAGVSTLERNLASIRLAFGGVPVTLVTGYRANLFHRFPLKKVVNASWESSGQLASLQCALRDTTAKRVIVIYGDVYVNSGNLQSINGRSEDVAVGNLLEWRSNWIKRYTNPLDDLESFRVGKGRVVEIGGPVTNLAEVQGQFAGCFSLSYSTFGVIGDLVSRDSSITSTGGLSKFIELDFRVVSVDFTMPWYELDTEADYQFARSLTLD